MMKRVWIIFGTLFVLYSAIIARLFYWQVISSQSLKISAVSQHTNKIKLLPKRGEILASDGSPIVVNEPAYTVYAEPQYIDDMVYTSRQLSPIIGSDDKKIYDLIAEPGRRWVGIAKKVNNYTKEKIDRLNLKGIGFEQSLMRYYPESSMAAHALGFVGFDAQSQEKGYFGLEGYYDRDLSGKDGSIWQEKDAKGNPLLIGKEKIVNSEDGRTLVLWLDRSIQYIVEKRLKGAIEKYGALSGSVIVMDPKSGGILAMASFPSYNPVSYEQFDQSFYNNPIVAQSYEPGSTFKPLIMAAAINEKVINPETTFNESGPVQIGEYSIKTWDEKYHGVINMTDVLRYSSNVGMVYVQKQLGKDKILKYIKDFGFGEKTNIDLEEESSPELRKNQEWTEIDYATASIGQGIAATPLQVVRAIGAIANGGLMLEPKMVKEFRESNQKTVEVRTKVVREVFSKKAAQLTTQMMVDAVKYGEAKWAAPKGYKIAGKTGTAQIPVAGHYDKDKTIASFVGFAPAQDPKFVMLVIIREPKTSQWGSETAAPLFFQIAKDMFSYLAIPPDPN